MRTILLLLALSAMTASAESPQGETPPQACADCLVLTPADVEKMKADFMELARQAYKAGQMDVRARCASLV